MYIKSFTDYSNRLVHIDTNLINKICVSLDFGIHDPISYKGINLFFLDLTTYSQTGTFKDWVGGYTIAYCLQNGISEFVTQSSGNVANSIAYYASKFKIKAIILYPHISRYKIISNWHSVKYAKFIEIEKSEREIKSLTEEVSSHLSIPWLPTIEHQKESNKVRAYYVEEYSALNNIQFDYMSQALSSGFGIFGFYKGADEIDYFKRVKSPSLIGIQQSMISPFYHHLYNTEGVDSNSEMLEPTLFRSAPPVSFLHEMKNIVTETNGWIDTLSIEEFNYYLQFAESLLSERGIEITRLGERIIEKAGLISLIGTLKQIDVKRIKENSNILVSITGGTAKGKRGEFLPPHILKEFDSKDRLFDLIS